MDVCQLWVLCVLSGRDLCDELITRLEESYWLWCVIVCALETSWMRRPWPTGRGGGGALGPKTNKQKKHSRWAKSALSSEHDCDMISNDAVFSLSEDWNGLKVIGYWHTVLSRPRHGKWNGFVVIAFIFWYVWFMHLL